MKHKAWTIINKKTGETLCTDAPIEEAARISKLSMQTVYMYHSYGSKTYAVTARSILSAGDSKTFQARLAQLIDESGQTVPQIAKKIGYSTITLYKFVQGSNLPSLPTLCDIADYFCVSLDYLCGRTDT